MELSLAPTFAGAALAVAAVAGGAPWFSDGLRAARLSRRLPRLEPRTLADHPSGLTRTRGRVALESPLVAPLSDHPCAGFRLEVSSAERGVVACIDEWRPFRIVDAGTSARLDPHGATWTLTRGVERTLARGEAISERLGALLARSPEAQWLRRTASTVTLVERVLAAGAECHVVGHARALQPFELEAEVELLRTGTDGGYVSASGPAGTASPASGAFAGGSTARAGEPDLWIDNGGSLGLLAISDRPFGTLRVPHARLRALGLVGGPIVTLGGLLHLASLAERLGPAGH